MSETRGRCKLVLTVEVDTQKGLVKTEYLVRFLDPVPSVSFPAWRLEKLEDGRPSEVYDVILREFGPTCDCPDFEYRRRNAEKGCKHVESLRAVGLLSEHARAAYDSEPPF